MSVTSFAALPGGTPLTGAVGFLSGSPGIVLATNTLSNAVSVSLGALGGVANILAGGSNATGTVSFIAGSNMTITNDGNANITFNTSNTGQGGNSIANGTASLAVEAEGSLLYTASTSNGAINNISLNATSAEANGGNIALTANPGSITATALNSNVLSANNNGAQIRMGFNGESEIVSFSPDVYYGNVAGGTQNIFPDIVTAQQPGGIAPSAWGAGQILFTNLNNFGGSSGLAWNGALSYQRGTLVTYNSGTYICIATKLVAVPPVPPDVDTGFWTAIGGGGSNVANPVTDPQRNNNNVWQNNTAYAVGSIVSSPTPPNNWYICYKAVSGTVPAQDPSADVNLNGNNTGQGQNWQLLSTRAFRTFNPAPQGTATFYGGLSLTGPGVSKITTTGDPALQGTVTIGPASGRIYRAGVLTPWVSPMRIYAKYPTVQPVVPSGNWCAVGQETNPLNFTGWYPCSLNGVIPMDALDDRFNFSDGALMMCGYSGSASGGLPVNSPGQLIAPYIVGSEDFYEAISWYPGPVSATIPAGIDLVWTIISP
jgi:hypothetical protein